MIQIPTFATWLEAHPVRNFSNEETAWAVYNDQQYRSVETAMLQPGAAEDDSQVAMTAATTFLESVFGAAWVKRKFPLADQQEAFDPWQRQAHQRQELARRVYEFQSAPWFSDFLKYTRTNEVASALFEADVLQTLMCMPAGVTRVMESKIKGQDFDILLHLPKIGDIPVEVKYKQDNTPFAPSTILNTVKGAAKQLPKDKVGCLFIHIPTSWVGPGRGDEYADALYDALRSTSRIGVVFTAVDKPSRVPEQNKIHRCRVWDYYRHDSASQELWEAALLLRNLLDNEMTFFAPHAPF